MVSTCWFEAGNGHQDWEGTAVADNPEKNDFSNYLVSRGLLDPDKEFLIAAYLYIRDNQEGDCQEFAVSAYLVEGTDYHKVAHRIRAGEEIEAREIAVKLTFQELATVFKGFSVMLTLRGLKLTRRKFFVSDNGWDDFKS